MICIATIVSANYLAYARTLEESVRTHQPDAAFRVLIVDRPTDEVKAAVARSGLQAVYAEDLGIRDFEHVAFKYELVELNTALKPTFLKKLFAEGFDKVAYLDPDIRVFSTLAPVFDALDSANIVLTPHAMAPAMDGLRPSDIDFLRNGTFNLGFVALRNTPESIRMLDWWEERCLTYGFNDLGFGTFVDQKWIDLVPCYFEGTHVLKHAGCNVAYWNLHEREVSGTDGNYRVGEVPLCFFHFSGVKAERPDVLSRHQTRHSIRPKTTLAELVADYCTALLRHEHKAFAGIKYTFGHFDNGEAITVTARRAACFTEGAADRPFAAGAPLHTVVKEKGMLKRSGDAEAGANTLSFDQNSRRVRTINGLVRGAASILGIERFSALARYMGYLTREANMARVLLDKPFELAHKRNNSRLS
jgi:hypothetical protein